MGSRGDNDRGVPPRPPTADSVKKLWRKAFDVIFGSMTGNGILFAATS